MKKKEMIEMLNSGKAFEINMERNLDEYGCTIYNDMKIYFKDFSVREYRGFQYALPTINGTGKRVKGKTLTINDYDFDNENNEILVKSFSINK